MYETVRLWLANNWFGLLGLVLSAALTIYIFFRQEKHKRPVFLKRNMVIVRNARSTFPNLSVHYKGHAGDLDNLDNVSVAVVAIWNKGRASLRRADCVATAPLRITAKEGVTILGASKIQESSEHNKVECEYRKGDNAVNIKFDFLDHNQGVLVEIMHTGVSASALAVEGTFVESGPVLPALGNSFLGRLRSSIDPMPAKRTSQVFGFLLGVLPLLLAVLLNWYANVSVRVDMPEGYEIIERNGKHYARVLDGWILHDGGKTYARLGDDYRIAKEGGKYVPYIDISPFSSRLHYITFVLCGFSMFVFVVMLATPTIPSDLRRFNDHLNQA